MLHFYDVHTQKDETALKVNYKLSKENVLDFFIDISNTIVPIQFKRIMLKSISVNFNTLLYYHQRKNMFETLILTLYNKFQIYF
jgi:hypothetical protein